MLSSDPRIMHLVALAVAKFTYGSLSSIRTHLGPDIELGLVGFAIVLRTRRDWFLHVDKHGLSEELIEEIHRHRGYTTSILEISDFTGISRSTTRRKMQKLEELGLIEKVEGDRWHLRDLRHNDPNRPAMMLQEMLQSFVSIMDALEQLMPEEVDATKRKARAKGVAIAPFALLEDEAEQKEKRGHAAE